MEPGVLKSTGFPLKIGFLVLWASFACAQQAPPVPDVPSNFKLDLEAAARMRPQLMGQSVPATGRHQLGRLVFDQLTRQAATSGRTFGWQLRIVEDGQLNAYASPDGTVYVESGLAELAGQSTGLWAAVLSHEIAHVIRRDWARRFLYRRTLEGNSGTVLMGDPGVPSADWTDSEKASADLGQFCRRLEIEADQAGLMLMARAGYHPDFVPALHHLLHAQDPARISRSLYATHPCWDERDRELGRAYHEAAIEFEHRWPAWYASPGGNPPVVVFAEEPKVTKMSSTEWGIAIPLRCQNLAGAVEVVLRTSSARTAGSTQIKEGSLGRNTVIQESPEDQRQLTGCTSPKTTVTFILADHARGRRPAARWTDVYVLDAWGAVLARADIPKLSR